MTYSKKFPRVYRKNSLACLMLDRNKVYVFETKVERTHKVPKGFTRCDWTDLSLLARVGFEAILIGEGIVDKTESLFSSPEFIEVEVCKGYPITKRRIKKHLLPTYYVAGNGYKTLREARQYVLSLQETPY